MEFTEIDGMILLETRQAAEEQIRRLQEQGAPICRWKYERGANHVHADMSAVDRERFRQELETAREFETGLGPAYPTRDFVISHIPGYAVSFYQLADDAPTENEVLREVRGDTAWCQHCQTKRPYRLLPEADPEFPLLKWGACTVCHHDIILGDYELRRVVRATQPSEPANP